MVSNHLLYFLSANKKDFFTRNKGEVFGLLPTTQSNLRTALGVEIFKLGIIARIWKPLPELFSDLCSDMGTSICSEIQI